MKNQKGLIEIQYNHQLGLYRDLITQNKFMIKSALPYTPAKSLAIVFFTCLFIANPAVSQNIEREIKMGNETQKAIEQQIGFYQHAASEYLKKIGS